MEISELNLPPLKTSRDLTARPLHAVALYDEWISLVYAQEALHSLEHSIFKDLYLYRSIWSFAKLTRLDLRHESIRVASEADIIIVVADSAATIPNHVISWLNASIRENGKGAPALVALDSGNIEAGNAASDLFSELSVISTRWGSPLLYNAEFDEHLEADLIADLTRRNEYRHGSDEQADLYRLLSLPPSGSWGLNE